MKTVTPLLTATRSHLLLSSFFLLLIALFIATFFSYRSFSPTINKFLGLHKDQQIVEHINKFTSLKTPEQYQEYNKQTEKIAVSAPYLDITSCSPSPQILKVKANTLLVVKNSSTKEHLITLNEKSAYSIGPHKNTSILLNTYPVVPGSYLYHCDQNLNVGMIFVQL